MVSAAEVKQSDMHQHQQKTGALPQPLITSLSAHVTHVSRTAMAPFKALVISEGGGVSDVADDADVRAEVARRLGISPETIKATIITSADDIPATKLSGKSAGTATNLSSIDNGGGDVSVSTASAMHSLKKLKSTTPAPEAGATNLINISERITIASLIRAFRAQLLATAPEYTLRKWSLYCGFEGRSKGSAGSGRNGGARRSIPMMLIHLPTEVTSATPAMTPAATAEYHQHSGLAPVEGSEKVISVAVGVAPDEVASDATQRTIGSYLLPLVSPDLLDTMTWSARVSFVVGEDEEEERARRAELKAATASTVGCTAQPNTADTRADSTVIEPAGFGAFDSYVHVPFGQPGLFPPQQQGFHDLGQGGLSMPRGTAQLHSAAVPASAATPLMPGSSLFSSGGLFGGAPGSILAHILAQQQQNGGM